MAKNSINQYHENRILTANPVAVCRILLEETIQSTRTARIYLAPEDSYQRGKCVSRAMNLLTEFMVMLSDEESPELANNLRRICEYAHHQLMSAHIHRSENELCEVIGLLQPLLQAWTLAEKRAIRGVVVDTEAAQLEVTAVAS